MHSVVHGQEPLYIFDMVTPVTRLPGCANLFGVFPLDHDAHFGVSSRRHLSREVIFEVFQPV